MDLGEPGFAHAGGHGVRRGGGSNPLLAAVAALGILSALVVAMWAGGYPTTGGFGEDGEPVGEVGSAAAAKALAAYGDLPLAFVENRGQTDERVRYHAQGPGYAFFLTPEKVVISLSKQPGATSGAADDDAAEPQGVNLDLRFVGANPDVAVEGANRAPGEANYIRGNDPEGWQTGLPGYEDVVYRGLWPGVDMMLRGQDGKLKYEFRVQPGANVDGIRLAYAGTGGLSLDGAGNMRIQTPVGSLRDSAPVSYQRIGGKRVSVESRYVLGGKGEYGFAVGAGYRPDRALVIDPGVEYSTLFGGSSDDGGVGIAVDGAGSAYVVGTTQSTNFPTTTGAFDRTFNGGVVDAFVTKLNAGGTGLVYSTYLGGTPTAPTRGTGDPFEGGRGIAVDANGNAYVTGQTTSGNFPTTSGAFDRTLSVGTRDATDGFVAKLNATGSRLLYSTFLGGPDYEDPEAIAIDAAGNAYVTGRTASLAFPTTAGAFDRTAGGGGAYDAFLTKLNATGSALAYSTYLGGAENESPGGVAVDSSGNAYVGGSTRSVEFPTTPGAFDTTHNGGDFGTLFDAHVTKFNPSGSALVYSTFLGGSERDFGDDVAVDTAGNAYLVGGTLSQEFPTTPGAFDATQRSEGKSFVTKLDASGSALVYSTFLREATAGAIVLDPDRNAWLAGGTLDPQAPTTPDAFDATRDGISDAWIGQLNSSGSNLIYATLLGGADADGAADVARDTAGNVYVTGFTISSDFPTTQGAFDRTFSGDPLIFWGDAFVTKFGSETTPPPPAQSAALSSLGLSPTGVTGGGTSTGTVTLTSAAPAGGASVALSSSNAAATVPASVTVPAGATSATFTVSTSSVSANTSATISAAYGGVTRTANLAVNATASSTDTVTVSRAEYESSRRVLRVEASSSNSSATLRVHVTSTNEPIGTLSGGRGGCSWPTNPQSITVRSSLGGSATRTVTLK